ncbi:MAG: oligosaccharide flippase family protein, partial [Firmicutes bacterium]|nr:oligosaccharide flippase family protein [Bacillota bacterium]
RENKNPAADKTALKVLKVAFLSLALLSVAAALPLIFFRHQIAALQGNPLAALPYLGIAPSILFVAVVAIFRGYFQGKGNMLPSGISQIVEQAIKLGAGLSLAAVFMGRGLGIEWAVFGAVLGVTLSEFVAMVVLSAQFLFLRVRQNRKSFAFFNRSGLFEAGADIALVKPKFGGLANQDENQFGQKDSQKSNQKILKLIYAIAVPVTLGSLIMPLAQVIDSVMVINVLAASGVERGNATALFGLINGPIASLINMPMAITLAISVALLPKIAKEFAKERCAEKGSAECLDSGILGAADCFEEVESEKTNTQFVDKFGELVGQKTLVFGERENEKLGGLRLKESGVLSRKKTLLLNSGSPSIKLKGFKGGKTAQRAINASMSSVEKANNFSKKPQAAYTQKHDFATSGRHSVRLKNQHKRPLKYNIRKGCSRSVKAKKQHIYALKIVSNSNHLTPSTQAATTLNTNINNNGNSSNINSAHPQSLSVSNINNNIHLNSNSSTGNGIGSGLNSNINNSTGGNPNPHNPSPQAAPAPDTKETIVGKGLTLTLLLTLPAAAVFLFFAPQIVGSLYSRGLSQAQLAISARLLKIESLSIVYLGIVQVATAALQGADKPHRPAINLLIGAIIKVLLTLALLPVLGIVGAAVATVVCYGLVAAINFFYMKKLIRPKINFVKAIALPVLGCVIMVGLAKLLHLVLSPILPLTIAFFVSLAIGGLAYLAFLLLTRAVKIKELLG